MTRVAEKLAIACHEYFKAKGMDPKGISMPFAEYKALRDEVNEHLPEGFKYSPQFYHGIPIVISPNATETTCQPQ